MPETSVTPGCEIATPAQLGEVASVVPPVLLVLGLDAMELRKDLLARKVSIAVCLRADRGEAMAAVAARSRFAVEAPNFILNRYR